MTPVMTRILSAAFALCMVAVPQLPPGAVDCAKPGTPAERLVCANPELRALDDRLGRFYGTALDFMDGSLCMKNDQRAWMADVRDKCTTTACLRDAYLKRLGALSLLQPGMNGANASDLPVTPRLRLFVPPVDPVDASRIAGSAPFEGRGVIGYEMNKGGFVLDTLDGTVHAIISDLAIDPGSHAGLDQLRAARTKVLVIGRHGLVDKTLPAFDNHFCIAIFQQ